MQSDPTGTRFAFEMGAAKTSGGSGWADVAKLGYFGWEYKSKDADLDKAYEQLLRYRDALQNPPLLIVSDINRIIIRTNYTNLPTRTITLTLDDLLTAAGLKTLKAVFFNPEQFKPRETIESVTQEAAAHFTNLADNLRKYGSQPQEIAHFLIRLLFCLFAEDIGLLPERLFPRLLEQTHHNSKDFSEVLQQLFRAMNKGGYFGADKILYFNGGLFDNDNVLPLDSADMDIIADIDALDWSAIKPSIFGTLFERGLDPSKRSQLGAHYTSEEDILLIVEPVLMQPLRREWEEIKAEVRKIKAEEEKDAKGKKSKGKKNIQGFLLAFADKIAATKVLDPACGSGNFLYVALRLLLDLQNEVFNFSDEMGAGRPYITVTPSQVHGIEINEYAHELAQMTIQIGYIQWLRDNGYGLPKEPILKPAETIQHMDAILAYKTSEVSETSEVYEPEWPAVDVIVGNPPFLGSQKMRAELGNKYVDDLRDLFSSRIPGTSDLVCYWFEKARALIENRQAKRVGLLATQGIRGGTNRTVLERIKHSGDIFWAQSDRNWILDGATVHVSMVGFDNRLEKHKELDGRTVASINSDLTSTIHDITKAIRLEENFDLCFQGPVKVGAFEITQDVANKFLRLSNPNGKSNVDVIRPWVNGLDITTRYRNMFIIDFGNMAMEEASLYEAPFEYIKRAVKPSRDKNNRARRRDFWWQHGETVPGLRIAIAKNEYFICTPRVSKHRLFVRFSSRTLPDSAVIAITREDDYFLGVLHSRIHELWARATGTQLREAESGFRYTPTSTFETFPFPWAPGKEPKDDLRVKAIAQAAKELVEQRDSWLNAEELGEDEKKKRTLTNLYNQRPTWLDLAHKKLDEAVCAAYGWQSDLSDEEILGKLLALNLERVKI